MDVVHDRQAAVQREWPVRSDRKNRREAMGASSPQAELDSHAISVQTIFDVSYKVGEEGDRADSAA